MSGALPPRPTRKGKERASSGFGSPEHPIVLQPVSRCVQHGQSLPTVYPRRNRCRSIDTIEGDSAVPPIPYRSPDRLSFTQRTGVPSSSGTQRVVRRESEGEPKEEVVDNQLPDGYMVDGLVHPALMEEGTRAIPELELELFTDFDFAFEKVGGEEEEEEEKEEEKEVSSSSGAAAAESSRESMLTGELVNTLTMAIEELRRDYQQPDLPGSFPDDDDTSSSSFSASAYTSPSRGQESSSSPQESSSSSSGPAHMTPLPRVEVSICNSNGDDAPGDPEDGIPLMSLHPLGISLRPALQGSAHRMSRPVSSVYSIALPSQDSVLAESASAPAQYHLPLMAQKELERMASE